jgi:hypothetical protein
MRQLLPPATIANAFDFDDDDGVIDVERFVDRVAQRSAVMTAITMPDGRVEVPSAAAATTTSAAAAHMAHVMATLDDVFASPTQPAPAAAQPQRTASVTAQRQVSAQPSTPLAAPSNAIARGNNTDGKTARALLPIDRALIRSVFENFHKRPAARGRQRSAAASVLSTADVFGGLAE